MLVLYIFILMFTNSINHIQKNIHSTFINRITILTLSLSIIYTYYTLYFQQIGKGISIYSGLFQITIQSQIVEIVLIAVGISILLAWPYLLASSLKKENATGITEIKNLGLAQASFGSEGSNQYSLIAIFSILGGSLLMSSLDFLSMYLSIELQSFALYILATLNKENLSATSAGLKYFLLGSLSSCFILLGSAIIYSYTGLTQFESINTLISVPGILSVGSSGSYAAGDSVDSISAVVEMQNISKAFTIGLIILIIGFLFKISAAPFYQWAPDVYDGTPTIVTVWLTIVVKLTILIFLLGLVEYTVPDSLSIFNTFHDALSTTNILGIKNLLLISSLLSLLIGTIAGLSQIKIKRLLAFSSISHVGFLLLALGIYTQKSVDSFLFYLLQYSLTSLNIFLILLALSYFMLMPLINKPIKPLASLDEKGNIGLQDMVENKVSLVQVATAHTAQWSTSSSLLQSTHLQQEGVKQDIGSLTDINYLIELKGQLYKNPILSISMAICLFSMAGVPPLIGFFSKQFVLYSSIENGNNFLSIVAILVSVISASYYLRLIKITFFDNYISLVNKNNPASAVEINKSKAAAVKRDEGTSSPTLYEMYRVTIPWGYAQESTVPRFMQESVSQIHSYIIAILTLLILFFFLDPSILLNGTQLISLTIYNI